VTRFARDRVSFLGQPIVEFAGVPGLGDVTTVHRLGRRGVDRGRRRVGARVWPSLPAATGALVALLSTTSSHRIADYVASDRDPTA
jgi:putative protein kinase ArgK-like GTPase of G3E family